MTRQYKESMSYFDNIKKIVQKIVNIRFLTFF